LAEIIRKIAIAMVTTSEFSHQVHACCLSVGSAVTPTNIQYPAIDLHSSNTYLLPIHRACKSYTMFRFLTLTIFAFAAAFVAAQTPSGTPDLCIITCSTTAAAAARCTS